MNGINNSLIFRPINPCDVNELYDFLNGLSDEVKFFFHPHKFDKNNLINLCSSKRDHYFVMYLDDKLIGYSMLRLFRHNVPSFGCCIHPDYYRKGYGYKLTRLTLNIANKLRYKRVVLKVNKKNKIAFNLYKKIGFKVIDKNISKEEIKMAITLI